MAPGDAEAFTHALENRDHAHDSHSHSYPHPPTRQPPPSDPGILTSSQLEEYYSIPPVMDPDEASYLIRTILAFKYYKRQTFAMNHHRMQQFYALSERHRSLIQPKFTEKLQGIDEAIEANAIIASRIARLGEEMYLGGLQVRMGGPVVPRQKLSLLGAYLNNRDMDKARSTLKQFVRDWSVEVTISLRIVLSTGCKGADPKLWTNPECSRSSIWKSIHGRKVCFRQTCTNFRAQVRVLVPGAGLGRIVYEILRAGYEVQGNELEFSMLMASNLALNELRRTEFQANKQTRSLRTPDSPSLHSHHVTPFFCRKSPVQDQHPRLLACPRTLHIGDKGNDVNGCRRLCRMLLVTFRRIHFQRRSNMFLSRHRRKRPQIHRHHPQCSLRGR